MEVNGKKLGIVSKFGETIYYPKTIFAGIGRIVNTLINKDFKISLVPDFFFVNCSETRVSDALPYKYHLEAFLYKFRLIYFKTKVSE